MLNNPCTSTNAALSPPLEHRARRAASAKLGWYIHALVYACVNVGLVTLSVISDKNWAVFPALGWGLGLVVHGAVVFLLTDGAGLHERLVQHERDRLTLNSDPW